MKFLIPQANICVQVTVLGARDIQVDKKENIFSSGAYIPDGVTNKMNVLYSTLVGIKCHGEK